MEKWKTRIAEQLKHERDEYTAAVIKWAQEGELRNSPKGLDVSAFLEADLQCEAVLATPTPYVLNVGCGFRVTSPGFRTKDGLPVVVVGLDPTAFAINEALKILEATQESVKAVRRFIYPITGEEMSAAIPVGAFDAVWSENALLDLVDPHRALTQMARATKVGGVVCVKFDPKAEGTMWKLAAYDGGKLVLTSERGTQEISEVRGERVEMHTMLDDTLMVKIRRPQRTLEEVIGKAKKKGLIVAPNGQPTG